MTLALLALPFGSAVASNEVEVGVTAASVIDAKGKPPVSPARDLETGVDVFFNEKISTDEAGRAQLLFRDGTSLTVGASSEMTIDEYVYDPATGTGDMVVSISKGVFRLVGGKISKNQPIIFNSPSATVSVRGGIAYVKESSAGLEAGLLYGTQLSVTSAASGLTSSTSQTGRAFSVSAGQTEAPVAQKINPEALAQDIASLEKSAEPPASDAADEQSGAADQPAARTQPEDSGEEPAAAESDQATAAPEPEPGEKPSEEGGAPEPGLAQAEPDPNQPPPEGSDFVADQENPEGPLPGNNQPPPEPGAEPLGPAPLAPGEPGEGFVAGDAVAPPPPPEGAEGFTPLPPGEPGEFGAPPLPKAGFAADIPATDLPPLPEGSEGEIYIATGAPPTGLPPLPGGSEGEITIPPGAAPLPPLPAGSDGAVYVAPDTLPATALPALPGASEGGIVITPGTSPTPGLPPVPSASSRVVTPVIPVAPALPATTVSIPAPPVPPTALKLEITSLTLDFSTDVAAYVPPIGSPIGGTPIRARAEPTAGITELTKAVDDTTRAPGVRTEDGTSVTAPTGGWEPSTAYTFTGATDAEKPAYFAPAATDTGSTPAVTEIRCDPETDGYCPTASEVSAGTVIPPSGAPEPGGPRSEPTIRIVEVTTSTTSCDAATGCSRSTIPAATATPGTATFIEPRPAATATSGTATFIEPRTAATVSPSFTTFTPSLSESETFISESESLSPSSSETTVTHTISCVAGVCSAVPVRALISKSKTDEPKPLVATGIFDGGTDFAMTSSIGQEKSSMRLVGGEIPLCKDCRFLKWHRKTTSITDSGNSISEIQHWISGAAATASDLAEAAGKTATYSGGLVGAVAGAGILQEKTGSFDARVQFGVSAYQVQNFSADFDGSRYSGASGLTPNNTVFHVTGASGTRTLQAGGYFFGGTTRGNAPPNIGGHFKVTGHDYHAAGVFAGSQR
mgnify:FL=1